MRVAATEAQMKKKHKSGTIEEWEKIARKVLAMPDKEVSRSEVDSVLVGITQSKDRWVKATLLEKRKRAWAASTTKQ